MQKKKGFSIIVVVFSFITLFALAAFVVDYAIYSNQRSELQKATEMTALSVASAITLSKDATGKYDYPSKAHITDLIESTFNMVKDPTLLKYASIVPEVTADPTADTCYVSKPSRAVKVFATVPAKTYFSHVLGLGVVNLQAQAAAISMPEYLTDTDNITYNPVSPIGGGSFANQSENITNTDDKSVVSLGPGGSLVIELDEFLVDAPGMDLLVKETGHKDGYFIFAGIENKDGGGTHWVNISCTGVPIGADYSTSSEVSPYSVDVNINGVTQKLTKFYGSAMFDLGGVCGDPDNYNAGLKYANKLYIVDDNEEDGFVQENYIPTDVPLHTLLLGDHSSITPGADIDSIDVLNHARLIPVKDLQDRDGDGLINYIENLIGTNQQNKDTDGDGYTDEEEYSGWRYNGLNNAIYFTSPTANDDLGVSF